MTTDIAKYGIVQHLPNLPFEDARGRVEAALQSEGFGILTEIDVRDTLRNKLDVEFRPYTILGACNPALAHQGLLKEPQLGLLLPCNVVISAEKSGTIVSVMDPYAMVKVTENMELEDIALEARSRLKRALESLAD
jgi:uncharacterized protein (DUF302 family)